jgi:extracellular elastinolytic metalloproteinase
MQDNWYEAAVSAHAPHRILSVVDWASDLYVPPPAAKGPAVPTYAVFGWGVNDPSEGNRSVHDKTPDALASPAGWHALPYANDPQSDSAAGRAAARKGKWRNTTSTWGNNVFAHENWEGRNSYVGTTRAVDGC